MKKAKEKPLRAEYDFSKGVRGKYAKSVDDGLIVVIAPDVAKTFKSSKAVNDALRKELNRRRRAAG